MNQTFFIGIVCNRTQLLKLLHGAAKKKIFVCCKDIVKKAERWFESSANNESRVVCLSWLRSYSNRRFRKHESIQSSL